MGGAITHNLNTGLAVITNLPERRNTDVAGNGGVANEVEGEGGLFLAKSCFYQLVHNISKVILNVRECAGKLEDGDVQAGVFFAACPHFFSGMAEDVLPAQSVRRRCHGTPGMGETGVDEGIPVVKEPVDGRSGHAELGGYTSDGEAVNAEAERSHNSVLTVEFRFGAGFAAESWCDHGFYVSCQPCAAARVSQNAR